MSIGLGMRLASFLVECGGRRVKVLIKSIYKSIVMSLSAKLKLGDYNTGAYDRIYSVVNCTYKLSKYKSESKERIAGTLVDMVVRVPEEKDLALYEWYTDMRSHSGCILIDFSDPKYTDGKRKIVFDDARCYSISEDYDIHATKKGIRFLKLKIACGYFKIDGDVEFIKE